MQIEIKINLHTNNKKNEREKHNNVQEKSKNRWHLNKYYKKKGERKYIKVNNRMTKCVDK